MTKSQNQIVPVEVQRKAEQDAAKLTIVAGKIVVTTASEEEKAYEGLTQIKVALKTIESARKKITTPLNQSLKAANAMFKTLSSPFKNADTIIRGKIMDFHHIQEEKAEKEMERREKIQASHEAKGHKTYELEEVEPEVAEVTTTVKRWTFEVTNSAKVPRKYLMLDSATIRSAIRTGERDIPGLRIFQEEGLRV